MSGINQKEYLKKYLGIGKGSGDKKKKKKKPKTATNGLKIVDDDIYVNISEEIKEDLNADNDEAPQIVSVIDDRPPSLRIDEETHSKLWKPIGEPEESEINEKNIKFEGSFKLEKTLVSKGTSRGKSTFKQEFLSSKKLRNSDVSPLRKTFKEEVLSTSSESRDSSPIRKKRKSKDSSHSRKNNNDKDNDRSPVRKRQKTDDNSPPRKTNRDKDISPPRRHNSSDRDQDISPPRKHNRNKDISPPRKSNKDRDVSPPKRYDRSDLDGDISPIRKSNKDRDISPPRRHKNNVGDRDMSSQRKKPSRWAKEESLNEKMNQTLDGKTAGLQKAADLVKETKEIRKREDELFKSMSAEISGANAATVVRGKKVVDFEEEDRKKKKEEENKEKYDKWGKGLKQVEDRSARIAEDLHEMSKPLARYADDEDLEKYLKDQERAGDPMLAYIRKKKRKTAMDEGKPVKLQYEGESAPNRFGIRPGYRWDGVDRSNGYERKWFEMQNSRKASLEENYKWSTEDM